MIENETGCAVPRFASKFPSGVDVTEPHLSVEQPKEMPALYHTVIKANDSGASSVQLSSSPLPKHAAVDLLAPS